MLKCKDDRPLSSSSHYGNTICIYGSKAAGRKKVLEMSVTTLHSKCRPIQTIHPTDLGLLPSWISISRPPAQEFSPSWNARKRVQEGLKFQEIPGK